MTEISPRETEHITQSEVMKSFSDGTCTDIDSIAARTCFYPLQNDHISARLSRQQSDRLPSSFPSLNFESFSTIFVENASSKKLPDSNPRIFSSQNSEIRTYSSQIDDTQLSSSKLESKILLQKEIGNMIATQDIFCLISEQDNPTKSLQISPASIAYPSISALYCTGNIGYPTSHALRSFSQDSAMFVSARSDCSELPELSESINLLAHSSSEPDLSISHVERNEYSISESDIQNFAEDDQLSDNLNVANGATFETLDDNSFSLSKEIKIWTDEENIVLMKAVERHNGQGWKNIAKEVPGRTPVQCLQHWRYVLSPELNLDPWSPNEDARIGALVDKLGLDWPKIAKNFPNRSAKRIRERYLNHLDPSLRHDCWTVEEITRLTDARDVYKNQWVKIARVLPGRSVNSIKREWSRIERRARIGPYSGLKDQETHHRQPYRTENFTNEESTLLSSLVSTFGTQNWSRIASEFPNRSHSQCMLHWFNVLDPNLTKGKGSWTKKEDDRLRVLVTELGPKWTQIASQMPGRVGKQCRERYTNHLNPNLRHDAWSQEEDLVLVEAYAKKPNKWAEIAKLLPGRCDNDVKNRWQSRVRANRSTAKSSYLGPDVVLEKI